MTSYEPRNCNFWHRTEVASLIVGTVKLQLLVTAGDLSRSNVILLSLFQERKLLCFWSGLIITCCCQYLLLVFLSLCIHISTWCSSDKLSGIVT